MPRIRSVKPETWQDKKFAERLTRDARLLYIALWNLADEHSRLQGDPRYIKGQVFPYDDDLRLPDIERLLAELATAGRITRYDFDGDPFIFLPKLRTHQRLEPDKVPSRLPEPPKEAPTCTSVPDAGSSESRADQPAPNPDENALLYVAGSMEPVAGSRLAPDEPSRAARKPDEIWDALLEACQVDLASVTGSSRGAYNKAVADLRAVDATPPEIRRRAGVFRTRWPTASLTPTALTRRWAECDASPARRPEPTRNDQVLAAARRDAERAMQPERRALP